MGAMGRFLDRVPDDARDRVIQAQDWTTSGSDFIDAQGCRCMVGHAEDWRHNSIGMQTARIHLTRWDDDDAYLRYEPLVRRVGLARAIELVKARAAKGNRIPLPQQHVGAGR